MREPSGNGGLFLYIGLPFTYLMTKQIPDRLIYNGKTYPQENALLSHYLHQKNITPLRVSSSLWRGYKATFEIIHNELFLTALYTFTGEDYEELIHQSFPGGLPYKLDFISCLIILYEGWVDGNPKFPKSYSTWQHYEVLEITNGYLTRAKAFTHEELELFKEEQYNHYLLTDEYTAKKQEAINEKQEAALKYPWMPLMKLHLTRISKRISCMK